jgi:hypothetical protein
VENSIRESGTIKNLDIMVYGSGNGGPFARIEILHSDQSVAGVMKTNLEMSENVRRQVWEEDFERAVRGQRPYLCV